MTTLTDELERFRQQMLEDARENEVELVRLAADLEKAEMGLIAQLRSVIQAHEQRREMFMAELRAFAGRLAIPNANQIAPALSHRRRWPRLGYASGKLAGHGSERREICELGWDASHLRCRLAVGKSCAHAIKRCARCQCSKSKAPRSAVGSQSPT